MPNTDPIKNRLNIRRNQKVRNQKANQAAIRDRLLDENGQPLTGSKAYTRWKNGEFAMIETATLAALQSTLTEAEQMIKELQDAYVSHRPADALRRKIRKLLPQQVESEKE